MKATIKKNPKPLLGRQYPKPVERLHAWEIVAIIATALLIAVGFYS